MLVSAHLIEETSQRPYVAFLIVGLFFAELWGQVEGSSDHCLSKISILMQQFGHAQVADLDHFVTGEEYVQRFDVPVQDALAMDVLKS